MRYSLGEHSAKGWHILDGLRMKMFYYNAKTKEGAQRYVGTRNLIEDIRVAQEREAQALHEMLLDTEEE